MYGIPRERVIGSSSDFAYTSDKKGGTITHKPEADYLDDGRRSRFESGTAPVAVRCSRPELQWRHRDAPVHQHADRPTLRLLVLTTTLSESSSTRPVPSRRSSKPHRGWTVVSIKNDWATVFAT